MMSIRSESSKVNVVTSGQKQKLNTIKCNTKSNNKYNKNKKSKTNKPCSSFEQGLSE